MTMVPLQKWLLQTFVCTMMLTAVFGVDAQDCESAPVPYEANYSIMRNGDDPGSMRVVLSQSDDGSYIYAMDTRVKWGIFTALIHQQSTFNWDGGIVLPGSFRLRQKVSLYKRSESVEFNWQAMKATGTKKKDDFELAIQPGMQDKLTIYLLLARELCRGKSQIAADVVSGPVLKAHSYHQQGIELLDTKLGQLQTTHLRRGSSETKKQTDLWHAGETRFLPVKMIYRNDDEISVMNLLDISFKEADSVAVAKPESH